MDWKHLLAYITGTVDQELLLRNEYLVTENRILRHQLPGRIRLSDGERKTLAEIGQKLGKQALKEVATIVKPDTILAWHHRLVAKKFDGATQRKAPGRPLIDQELEALIVRMAKENRSWGYDRIVGAVVPEYSYLLEYLTFVSLPCILGSNHVALFLASSHKGPVYAIRLLSPDGLRRIVVSVSQCSPSRKYGLTTSVGRLPTHCQAAQT